jgi:hypothetical protein
VVFTICIFYSNEGEVNKMARRCVITERLWKLTVFMTDGREKVIALYDDEGEALVDALLLAEDDRLLGYQIEPVKYEANKNEKIQS